MVNEEVKADTPDAVRYRSMAEVYEYLQQHQLKKAEEELRRRIGEDFSRLTCFTRPAILKLFEGDELETDDFISRITPAQPQAGSTIVKVDTKKNFVAKPLAYKKGQRVFEWYDAFLASCEYNPEFQTKAERVQWLMMSSDAIQDDKLCHAVWKNLRQSHSGKVTTLAPIIQELRLQTDQGVIPDRVLATNQLFAWRYDKQTSLHMNYLTLLRRVQLLQSTYDDPPLSDAFIGFTFWRGVVDA